MQIREGAMAARISRRDLLNISGVTAATITAAQPDNSMQILS
ncbi:hypothetical protein KKC1_02470 [Calderihabitans maritimus]|uniref:Twin-arginine translocation signal domain-containing protein n=1 Tax=Calderihabitans maritimus TaxID=1246530 RepID=A0A1Z5HP61_9FIRM|nr:hypothetical protein KKC1_02470 [Calderihabitans maritimus]